LNDHVIEVLKAVHGTQQTASGEQAFWEIGVEKRTVKDNAYKRQQDESLDKRLPKEAYLELLDLKAIIEQKNNWPHFHNMYNLQMPGEQRGKPRFTSWIAQLNEIRRITAHKSSLRTYKESDFEFLDWLRGAYYEPVRSDRHRED
jgi:DNA sulfur modification protein DndB